MSQISLADDRLNHPKPLLTTSQWAWLAIQLVVLLSVAMRAYLMNRENFALLWQDSLGIKMSLGAGFLLLMNLLVFAGGSVLLNKFIQPREVVLHRALVSLLALASFYFLYLPVVFVLLNGPAALAIQRNLLL